MPRKDDHDMIEVVCPGCERPRLVRHGTTRYPGWTGLCLNCAKGSGRHGAAAATKASATGTDKDRRLCRKCDKPFVFAGPHNRLCQKCGEVNKHIPEEEAYSFGKYSNGLMPLHPGCS